MSAVASRNVTSRFSAEEWKVRCDLAAAYRLIAHYRMDDVVYTPLSARVPGEPSHFLLNPYGLRFDEITASSLVKVDLDGRLVDDPLSLGMNPAGFTIHSAIIGARPDVGSVVHTHTPAGIAVSCQKHGLLPLNQWALQFYGHIGSHPYEGIALDLDERERLIAALGTYPVLILQNHGLLTVGASVAQAFKLMYNLERSCQAQVQALAGGAELVFPSEAVMRKTAAQYWDGADKYDQGGEHDIAWQSYLRLLTKLGEDYDR